MPALERQYQKRMSGMQVSSTSRIDLMAENGSQVPSETSASLIQFNGSPADLVIISDISERIETEGVLLTNEKTLQVLLDSTHDLALLVSHDGTVLAANKKAAERYGKNLD